MRFLTILYSFGSSPIIGRTLSATGLYFFFAFNNTSAGCSPSRVGLAEGCACGGSRGSATGSAAANGEREERERRVLETSEGSFHSSQANK